jgi:hypothetical protein
VLVNVLFALALVGVVWQVPGCRPPLDCMTAASPRIASGHSYAHPLQDGLVFRFTAETGRLLQDGREVWHITVGPDGPDDRIDYVWPVSPPINSTRHLFVGPGLDWTASDSVRMNPRRLHFVLGPDELRRAERVYQDITRQVVAGAPFDSARLRDLGRGELTVTLEDVVMAADRIGSLRIFVRSCVPH